MLKMYTNTNIRMQDLSISSTNDIKTLCLLSKYSPKYVLKFYWTSKNGFIMVIDLFRLVYLVYNSPIKLIKSQSKLYAQLIEKREKKRKDKKAWCFIIVEWKCSRSISKSAHFPAFQIRLLLSLTQIFFNSVAHSMICNACLMISIPINTSEILVVFSIE